MQLFLSLTKCGTTMERILEKRDKYVPGLELGDVLISPLLMRPGMVACLKRCRPEIGELMVDCGAFLVQQGRLDYSQLVSAYQQMLPEFPEANWYVLPDHIPVSQDSRRVVQAKVEDTIRNAARFAKRHHLLDRRRLVPVVQGRVETQFEKCIDTYAELGVKRIGFGSLVTNGPANGINSFSRRTIDGLRQVITLANKNGLELHLFGVSGPVQLLIAHLFGVTSTDSSAWNRIAGYGLVYFPFLRSFYVGDGGRHCHSPGLRRLQTLCSVLYPDFTFAPSVALRSCMYTRSLQNWKTLRYMNELVGTPPADLARVLQRWAPRSNQLLLHARTHLSDLVIRKAVVEDLPQIRVLARSHYRELGFLGNGEIAAAVSREEVVVAEQFSKIVGFQEYRRLKREPVTRLYHKAVIPRCRLLGIGRRLVQHVAREAISEDRKWLVLKCVEGIPANAFHKKCGFKLIAKEAGKRRPINVYSLSLCCH